MKKTNQQIAQKQENQPAAEFHSAADQAHPLNQRKIFQLGVFVLLLAGLIFSACSFNLDTIRTALKQITVTPETGVAQATPSLAAEEQSGTETVEPPDISEITNQHVLTIWLPPQFDPNDGTPAGDLLRQRLDAFMTEYPNVEIDVRIKAISGPGGLLESLTTASAAAPDAMPTLILLNRASLETAALKGLINPLDDISTTIDDTNWYEYARELAIIQSSVYGLPFAGDAMILVYRPSQFSTVPKDWDTIMGMQQQVLFPAADPEGLLTLAEYRSLGAPIQDTQLHPTLDAEQLSVVFNLYEDGARNGVFLNSSTQYQADSQVWQAYTEKSTHAVITWSSHYLSELPADSSATPLPVLGDEAYTIADGWMWALSDTDPERKVLGVALAEYLVDSNFMAEWAPNTGYLPTRPTSLASINNQNLKTLLSQVVISSHVRPSTDLTTAIGPAVQEAAVQIIKRQINAMDAAQTAADKLQTPAQ